MGSENTTPKGAYSPPYPKTIPSRLESVLIAGKFGMQLLKNKFYVREKIKEFESQVFSVKVSNGLHVKPPKISEN